MMVAVCTSKEEQNMAKINHSWKHHSVSNAVSGFAKQLPQLTCRQQDRAYWHVFVLSPVFLIVVPTLEFSDYQS